MNCSPFLRMNKFSGAEKLSKFDIFYFRFVPSFYLSFLLGVSFNILFSNLFGSPYISALVSLVIIIVTLLGLKYNNVRVLSRLDRRDNYYVVEDTFVYKNQRICDPNACVPIVPGVSAIIVGRSLVENLTEDELKAVIKHEEGHIVFHHPKIIVLSLIVFNIVYYELANLLESFMKQTAMGYATYVTTCMAINVVLALFIINLVLRLLEAEADTYAVLNGFKEQLKRALEKIYRMGGNRNNLISRFFDPHPTQRPAIVNINDISYNLKVISPLILLLSLALTLHVAREVLLKIKALSSTTIVLFTFLFVLSVFIIATFIAYILLLFYKAVGIDPYHSRVIVMFYYVLTLIPLLVFEGYTNVHVVSNILSCFLSPLIVFRKLRLYLKALVPLMLMWILNMIILLIPATLNIANLGRCKFVLSYFALV